MPARRPPPDREPVDLGEHNRELIRRSVDAAPPLTAEQIAKLRLIIYGSAAPDRDTA